MAPLAGINAVDFWLVRRLRWRVPDFYKGNSESIYWFKAGLHWRAFLAWCLAVWPSFRESSFFCNNPAHADPAAAGFIAATGTIEVSTGWERCFSVTWIIGFCGAGAVYYCICLLSPPPGKPYEVVHIGAVSSDGHSLEIDEGKQPSPSVRSSAGN